MIVIIFRIIRITSTIILIIIMNRYSKSIRSSYKSCFLHCLFCEKKSFLILLLYVLTLFVVFKKSGNLFQILGRYERLFCPCFRNGWWLTLNKDVLVAVVVWSVSLNTSFIYKGLKYLNYSRVIELIHCSNRSFMGSQFIFSNSVIPIWALIFKFR